METKKDIGKTFKHHLKQMDFSPSAKVWEQIEKDLDKKERKKRLFIWYCFSGILLSLLLGGTYFVVNGNYSFTTINETIFRTNKLDKKPIPKNVNENESFTNKSDKNSTNENKSIENNASNYKNVDRKSKITTQENINNLKYINKKNALETTINKPSTLVSKRQVVTKKRQNFNRKKWTSKKGSGTEQQSVATHRSKFTENSNDLLEENNIEKTLTTEYKLSELNNNLKVDLTLQNQSDTLIKVTDDIKKSKTIVNAVKETSLTKKNEATTKEKKAKIIIAPYYGLNYGGYFGNFNSLSNNKIIDRSTEIHSTYGALFRWMLNNKFGMQTGIGKITSGYSTIIEKTGISFINSQNVSTKQPINELNAIFSNDTRVKFTLESTYIEVPLEAYIVLKDKKLGLATTFGLSILIEDNNSVFAESESVQKKRIGNLKTIAGTSATFNAKVNLFYKLTPSLQLDIYPTFQYQVLGNTDASYYSNFFLSLRTGLSYKF